MTNTFLIKTCAIIIVYCFINHPVKAQTWLSYPASAGTLFDQPDFTSPFPFESVGIGDFNTNFPAVPLAALHINSNFLPATANFQFGNVFLTDAPAGSATDPVETWIMNRVLAGTSTEIGKFFNNYSYVNGTDFEMQATQNDGSLVFRTGVDPTNQFLNERMRIYEYSWKAAVGQPNRSMIRMGFGAPGGGGANAYGNVFGIPIFLAVGNYSTNTTTPFDPEYTIAEFRSQVNNGQSGGIKIRGSRSVRNYLSNAFIDLANWHQFDNAEFTMARLSSDMEDYTNHDGIFQVFTNVGISGGNTLTSKLLMTSTGLTGVGTIFDNGDNSVLIPAHLPHTRIESYDPTGVQLRLTQTYDVLNPTIAANGSWTDFQTNTLGNISNLYIHPSSDIITSGTPVNGRVGINIQQPGNTLEINSNNTPISPVNGNSGLKFSDLTYASTPLINNHPDKGVLSVDNDGDVILVFDEGGGNVTNCAAGGTTNHISKYTSPTTICESAIWENSSIDRNVSIGMNNLFFTPAYQLHVTGQSLFSDVDNDLQPDYYNGCTLYTLGVRTLSNSACTTDPFGGLAILSAEPVPGSKIDRLHIYSDNTGTAFFSTIGNRTLFMDKTIANAASLNNESTLLAFQPTSGTVVIRGDYTGATPAVAPSGDKLYVEVNNASVIHGYPTPSGIWSNNIATNQGSSISIKANSSGNNFTPFSNNTAGEFRGENSWRNYGIRSYADNIPTNTQPTYNVAGYFHAQDARNQNIGVQAEVSNSNAGIADMGGEFTVTNSNISGLATGGHFVLRGACAVNKGLDLDVNSATLNYGITTRIIDAAATNNYGASCYLDGATGIGGNNVGASYRSDNANNNYGSQFTALFGTNVNYGVYSVATPAAGTIFNAAIYGRAPGIPLTPIPPAVGTGSFAGYFSGDVGHTGNLWFISDATIKTDIQPLNDVNSILSQINSYTYYFDTLQLEYSADVPHSMQYGLLAQEVEAVAPNLVLNTIIPPVLDSSGAVVIPAKNIKMLNSLGMIPLLVQANNEQNNTIDSLILKDSILESRVTTLEQMVASCCNQRISDPNPNTNTGSIELENLKSIQLEQNDPNPFSQNSIIRWSIPTDFREASLLFFDNSGNQINKYKIEQKGNGELQVFGSKLSAGIYTYSLIVDSKLIDSKKMMRAK